MPPALSTPTMQTPALTAAAATAKCPDTFDSGSTDNAAPVFVSTTARDNEHKHKHKRARTPPFDASPQVHPTAAPQLDKPEKPPPTRRTDTTLIAPNSQFVQGHAGHTIADLTRALTTLLIQPVAHDPWVAGTVPTAAEKT